MTTKLIPATAGQWVDFRDTGKPLSWYQSVKAGSVVGVFIDTATGGYSADVGYALQAGLEVQLFQGYYDAMWNSVGTATSQGNRMVAAAKAVLYPRGATCWLDAEGMPSDMSANAWLDWVNAWSKVVNHAGYNGGIYLSGTYPVTSAQLYTDLPYIHHYWHGISAMTPPVATRGYTVSQNQVNVGLDGRVVDWDTVYPDNLHQLPFAIVGDTGSQSSTPPTTATPTGTTATDLSREVATLQKAVVSLNTQVQGHGQALTVIQGALTDLVKAVAAIKLP